jgi:hypothetical protein
MSSASDVTSNVTSDELCYVVPIAGEDKAESKEQWTVVKPRRRRKPRYMKKHNTQQNSPVCANDNCDNKTSRKFCESCYEKYQKTPKPCRHCNETTNGGSFCNNECHEEFLNKTVRCRRCKQMNTVLKQKYCDGCTAWFDANKRECGGCGQFTVREQCVRCANSK